MDTRGCQCPGAAGGGNTAGDPPLRDRRVDITIALGANVALQELLGVLHAVNIIFDSPR